VIWFVLQDYLGDYLNLGNQYVFTFVIRHLGMIKREINLLPTQLVNVIYMFNLAKCFDYKRSSSGHLYETRKKNWKQLELCFGLRSRFYIFVKIHVAL
jgi:hypothetical protein